jgi:protein gp37
MNTASWHTFQVLTKRPERAKELASTLPWPSNVWLGTSVENESVLNRVDSLREIPANVRFLSLEPLLGPLKSLDLTGISWVIVGGESGPKARPMKPEWVREIRDKATSCKIPFFFKQWGGKNKKITGRSLDGKTWDEMPTL